jgi:hypothetical protein
MGDDVLQIHVREKCRRMALMAWAVSLLFLKWTLSLEPLALADMVVIRFNNIATHGFCKKRFH